MMITPDPWVQGVLSRSKRREKENRPAHCTRFQIHKVLGISDTLKLPWYGRKSALAHRSVNDSGWAPTWQEKSLNLHILKPRKEEGKDRIFTEHPG